MKSIILKSFVAIIGTTSVFAVGGVYLGNNNSSNSLNKTTNFQTQNSEWIVFVNSLKSKLNNETVFSNISNKNLLIYHPYSVKYKFDIETITEENDKNELILLIQKLNQKDKNYPKITLASPTPTSEKERSSTPQVKYTLATKKISSVSELTNKQQKLMSKYWLEILPYIDFDILKCLTAPAVSMYRSTFMGYVPTGCPEQHSWTPRHTSWIENLSSKFSLKKETTENNNDGGDSKISQDLKSIEVSGIAEINGEINPKVKSYSFPKFTFPPSITNKSKLTSHFDNYIKISYETKNTVRKPDKNMPHFELVIGTYKNNTQKKSVDVINNSTTFTDPGIKTTKLPEFIYEIIKNPNSFNSAPGWNKEIKNGTVDFLTRYLATLYALFWAYSENTPHQKQIPTLNFLNEEISTIFDIQELQNDNKYYNVWDEI